MPAFVEHGNKPLRPPLKAPSGGVPPTPVSLPTQGTATRGPSGTEKQPQRTTAPPESLTSPPPPASDCNASKCAGVTRSNPEDAPRPAAESSTAAEATTGRDPAIFGRLDAAITRKEVRRPEKTLGEHPKPASRDHLKTGQA
jgi:hypothetical protein